MFQADRIDHVEVFVHDIAESIRWYDRVLGLKETFRWDPEPVMIGSGGTMLALFTAEAVPTLHTDPRTNRVPHWHRVAWRTDSNGFALAQRHLKECGVPYRGPVDHALSHSIYFHDPDGNPLEITYYLGTPDEPEKKKR